LLGIYNWLNSSDLSKIKMYSDDQFANYCNQTLFGSDFPKN